jgi:hypothetical protein
MKYRYGFLLVYFASFLMYWGVKLFTEPDILMFSWSMIVVHMLLVGFFLNRFAENIIENIIRNIKE